MKALLILCLLLTGCGAGLDDRPECEWQTVAHQSQPICKVPG